MRNIMEELENDEIIEQPRRMRFDWLLPLFLKPRDTLKRVIEKPYAVWLVPLLVLSALVILAALAASPVRSQQAIASQTLPPDFQYYSPEDQQRMLDSQQNAGSFVLSFVLPAAGSLIGMWVSWFLLGSLLHLLLTLAGSRSSNLASLNLTAWASLPLALRQLVHLLAALLGGSVVSQTGLSALAPAGASGFGAFLAAFLNLIDLYLVWQVILILIGVVPLTGLAPRKARLTALAAVFVLLLLQSLPGFLLGGLFSGGSSTGMFFF